MWPFKKKSKVVKKTETGAAPPVKQHYYPYDYYGYTYKPDPKSRDGVSPEGEELTEGEVAIAQSIFGDEIDTTHVRKYFYPDLDIPEWAKKETKYLNRASAATVGPEIIEFFGYAYHATDYSRPGDIIRGLSKYGNLRAYSYNYGAFCHELAHIWQYQNLSNTFNEAAAGYEYKLSKKTHFENFGKEQQASIIQDYALRFLFPEDKMLAYWIVTTPKNDELLQKVVEERFPHARNTRLSLGR